jgi:hypothetical protein
MGEPTDDLKPLGVVEVGDNAVVVAVAGSEQAGLPVAVVDEPSSGAGIDRPVLGVIDADPDTRGQSGRRVVAQVEVRWRFSVGGRSKRCAAAADCRCGNDGSCPRGRTRQCSTGRWSHVVVERELRLACSLCLPVSTVRRFTRLERKVKPEIGSSAQARRMAVALIEAADILDRS